MYAATKAINKLISIFVDRKEQGICRTKVVLEMAIENKYTALHYNLEVYDSYSKLSKSIEIRNLSLFYSQHN